MLVTDTKNRAGLIQSEGALVDAAAFTVADKQKLLTLVQAQQASNSDKEDMDLAAPAASLYKTHSGGILVVSEDMKRMRKSSLQACARQR